MKKSKTALVLIGYQNDFFSEEGILKSVVEESSRITGVLNNTINLLHHINDILIVATPILFTEDYRELDDPIGILKTIKDVGAFKKGAFGSKTIKEFDQFGDKILEISGKQGLNSFVNTELETLFKEKGITNLVFAGTVCSICIDSTGRAAFEKGFNVTMLSDCISGRSAFEQNFYMENIFPLYAKVSNSTSFINSLAVMV